MDAVLIDYFAAWNEIDAVEREHLLRRSVSDSAELVDPLGRWQGVAGISDRIATYHESAPGTRVVPGSGVDAHNDVERYAWRIVDPQGSELMEGLDITTRDSAGRLHRITMFHGPLPSLD